MRYLVLLITLEIDLFRNNLQDSFFNRLMMMKTKMMKILLISVANRQNEHDAKENAM